MLFSRSSSPPPRLIVRSAVHVVRSATPVAAPVATATLAATAASVAAPIAVAVSIAVAAIKHRRRRARD